MQLTQTRRAIILEKCASALRSRVFVHKVLKEHGNPEWRLMLRAARGAEPEHIGTMMMDMTDHSKIVLAKIYDGYKNLGLGKKFYGEVARRQPGGVLKSDNRVSAEAARVWDSNIRRGRATQHPLTTRESEGNAFLPHWKEYDGVAGNPAFTLRLPAAAIL